MTIYIARDDNPEGGYFSFGPEFPTLASHPHTITEVRTVEGYDHLWDQWQVGTLPKFADGTLDELLAPLWPDAERVWIKE